MKVTKKNKFKKDRPISKLIQDLDKIFSLYIRLKYQVNGVVRCVTCGKTFHFKQIQNGHFVSRQHRSLRWDERNCHPQCCGCNVFKHGNMVEYSSFMIKTYGDTIIEELLKEQRLIFKVTRQWLLQQINYYKKKVKELDHFQ